MAIPNRLTVYLYILDSLEKKTIKYTQKKKPVFMDSENHKWIIYLNWSFEKQCELKTKFFAKLKYLSGICLINKLNLTVGNFEENSYHASYYVPRKSINQPRLSKQCLCKCSVTIASTCAHGHVKCIQWYTEVGTDREYYTYAPNRFNTTVVSHR